MAKNEQKPAIRFQGFTDAWEQRKLSALCDKFTDGDWIESKDQSDSGVRLVQTGNVGVAEYLDKPNNRKWISDDTFARLHCEEVLPGDILISRLPEPAGRACIMPVLGTKMITVVDCTIAKTTPDVSNKFLVQYLSSQAYFDAVNTCLAGGTRQRISRSNLAEFAVPIPSDKAEQEAVGSFFGNLDTLITLHQRKYDKLLSIKKSMLEKMFPRDGSKYPEIRFSGFTDPWEQRKVTDMFKITRGYVLAAPLTSEQKSDEMPYPVYSSQTKDQGLMGYYKEYLYEDAITWTTDGANAGTVNYRAGKFYCTNVCGVLLVDKVVPNQMIAEALNNVAKGHVSYVGNPKLMNNVMAEIEISLPSSAEERDRITEFFSEVDDLITLHQRKLEKLKNIKKSMLEKMFV